ncbi:enoyl-CoA hydratase/carnithine racemase [Nocardioides marinisabuli]|uniref:Enoyl-CoA hydratase/carnithine racemase n=1 Tax=Nocardioides marinisabuli TaxID=419476 RepID=A0A7Y9JRX0_9ACTN|nr:enoyl-CoA hydratase/isomerase family protein [Nocardioides marinisabuli]NYD57159.1 enoyl-CoA hydratase/carnithine racemase [Nocardioides marinisabuli]
MTALPIFDELRIDHDGQVAILEIARPPANYFDRPLITAIADALDALAEDGTTRAAVLASEGKHFCAGANFGVTAQGVDRAAESRRLYAEGARLFKSPLPVVAAVQGSAVGGGLGLACAADFRVASTHSRFLANFSTLGFHQGFGLSVSLPRIIGAQAAALMLVGSERIDGGRALELGLADRLTEPGKERDGAIALAQELAARAPLAVHSIRETLRGDFADRVVEALDREASEQARLWQSADSREGIAASLERRAPIFTGR